jgi:hypothetical protein
MIEGANNNTMSSSSESENIVREAGFGIKRKTKMHDAEVIELEIPEHKGRQSMLYDRKDEAVTLGIRIDLPADREKYGLTVNSDKAMTLLGILTSSLSAQGLHAQLSAGKEGVEGVLVYAYICRDKLDAKNIRAQATKVGKIVESLAEAFEKKEGDLMERVRFAVRFQAVSTTLINARAKPAIIPTFDEQIRDQMMMKNSAKES